MTFFRRPLFWIIAVATVSSVAALFFYFYWSQPLLDGSRIVAFSYGPQRQNPLEFKRHERADDPRLAEIVDLIDKAHLSRAEVKRAPDQLLVILFRDDGLQYRLFLDGPRPDGSYAVGISEGDESYMGSLSQPQLVELLRSLQGSGG